MTEISECNFETILANLDEMASIVSDENLSQLALKLKVGMYEYILGNKCFLCLIDGVVQEEVRSSGLNGQ